MTTEPSLTQRFQDPIVVIAVLTAIITVVGNYFSTRGELDALAVQVTALEREEQAHDSQHTIEWATQTATNTLLTLGNSEQKQDLAVLRAELDGVLRDAIAGKPGVNPHEH